MSLVDVIGSADIVVVLGNGGVGKTTLAGALALSLAKKGQRVLAVTVDPANRLKDSLGLSGHVGVEEPVPLGETGKGSLHALLLDAATELERVVRRLLPDEKMRRRITEHVFFSKAAATMTGTHEYTAMERVLEALESGRYDKVVLDTPPERHALDFLDAPLRLGSLLSSEVFRLFVRASSGISRAGLKALRFRSVIVKGIGKFAGEETFLSLLDLILAFEPLYETFRRRAETARTILTGERGATVVVCRPGPRGTAQVMATLEALRGRGIRPVAIVANRVHVWPPPSQGAFSQRYSGLPSDPVDAATVKDAFALDPGLALLGRSELQGLTTKVLLLAREYLDLVERDRDDLDDLEAKVAPTPLFRVPLLQEEVCNLSNLEDFAKFLG